MKNTWIAVVAVVMLVSANVYAADSLVLAQANTSARQAATQSRTKNSVLGTNKKAARQARREAVAKARAARREAARQGRTGAVAAQNVSVVASQAAQEESVMEKFDEVESMMLANDVVEEIKTAQEQAVQDEEEKVLSPSSPSK